MSDEDCVRRKNFDQSFLDVGQRRRHVLQHIFGDAGISSQVVCDRIFGFHERRVDDLKVRVDDANSGNKIIS